MAERCHTGRIAAPKPWQKALKLHWSAPKIFGYGSKPLYRSWPRPTTSILEPDNSPRFAWGGRPHRRFISVRERGKNRSKTSCSTMLPIGASQAKQFSLFPPVEASQARIFTFPPVEASQAREFSLFPPWRLPKLGNFRFSPRGGFPS